MFYRPVLCGSFRSPAAVKIHTMFTWPFNLQPDHNDYANLTAHSYFIINKSPLYYCDSNNI